MPRMWWNRPDGTLVRDADKYRRIMQLLMRGRNESAVMFEQRVDAAPALAFLDAHNRMGGPKATLLHLVTYALGRTLAERPRLNRFSAGGRLYQRNGIQLSFSAKRAMSESAPVVVVKLDFDPSCTFAEHVERVHAALGEQRSDKPSRVDKELDLLFRLPHWLLRRVVPLAFVLDGWGMLPRSFIEGDPLFASAFIANLGSIGLDAAHHHLYEYGNIPLFATMGALRDVPHAADDGSVRVRRELALKWSFDERVEDGLYCAHALELFRRWLEEPQQLVARAA